jgi:hypothetical protein
VGTLQRNNHNGGKNGNKSKDNNEKTGNSAGEGQREKRKVKCPCNLCTDDHLTHLCPKLAEAARILAQSPAVLTNPFPHQHLASSSSNVEMQLVEVKTSSRKMETVYVSIWSMQKLM